MLTFWNCRGVPEEMPERAVVESSRWVSFSALMPLDQGIATAIGRHMGSNVDALLPGDARANSVSFAICLLQAYMNFTCRQVSGLKL